MSYRRAVTHLKKSDPVLAALITKIGKVPERRQTDGEHFDAVLRAIVYQQLSTKAAATILGRVLALYGGRYPTPKELLATRDEDLRAAGLSRQKLDYVKDLAARCASGDVPIDRLHELDDAGVMDALTRVKGVGPWTAQMFLMFRLGRPDVLPVLDLGIQTAIQRAYRMRKRPSPKQIEKLATRWRPHCTVACWYLWRSLA